MKVLIITPYGNFNYGNKFQNYAMQCILEKYGCEACTITNKYWYSNKKNEKESIIIKLKVKIWNLLFGRKRMLREKMFKNFSSKYIKSKKYDANISYDKVCIGSDQIWNPYFSDKFYYTYGQFSKDAFSYAASFGVDKIPDEYKEEIKKGLNNLKNISVREGSAIKIVEDLTGRGAELLVDPTMLLTSNEWDKVIEAPKKKSIPSKYIFTYFLGEIPKSTLESIEKLAQKIGAKIIDCGQSGEEAYYTVSPSEFLYFLKNSECVFTDSFHGVVFSIIYKKIFYVFDRKDSHKSMSSRIDTLLEKFNMKERKVNEYTDSSVLEMNFEHVDEILKKERKKSDKYLRKALDIKENEIEN